MSDDGLYPVMRPEQPVRPFWMGDYRQNMRWEVVQGDCLAYFIALFCECPMTPDITDWTFVFTVKASLDPADPNILSQVIWTEQHGLCGWTCLIWLPEQTMNVDPGRYAFDLKYRTRSTLLTQTIARGELDVLPTSDLTLAQPDVIPPPLPGLPVSAVLAAAKQNALARLTK
jgi:hypothetical protein